MKTLTVSHSQDKLQSILSQRKDGRFPTQVPKFSVVQDGKNGRYIATAFSRRIDAEDFFEANSCRAIYVNYGFGWTLIRGINK